MEESKRVKKKKGHPSLILSRSELRECLAGRAVSQFVCIDFESFFDCQPSEIALACIALGEDGSHRHVDSFHALIAPRFDPAMLTRDQSSSASYIESKVTGIPACPPEVSARNDFQQLFAQMMEFVRKYDQLGVLFCKACLMEARSLFFLAEAAGIDEENARLPLLGECQDLVELLVQRELSQNTFNIFVKEFAFDLKACCQFHFNVNKERLERNREPFHCALQDATSFGEVMLAVKQNPERLNAIDAVEKEKDRIRQEERRRKEEEERLLPGLDWGVFRCRGASFKLLIGRSPRSPKEVEDVEKVLGVSMIVTADTDVELLLDSDCGIHQVRSCDTIADLDRERKVGRKKKKRICFLDCSAKGSIASS